MTAPRPAGEAGFTLLEILVALVVLGFLMVGLTQGVRFGLRAWDTETRLVNSRADIDAAERTLRELIAAADPGDFNEPLPLKGSASMLSFTARLPVALPDLPVRDAELGLGVDARRRLVLRWTPRPHAEPLTVVRPRETVLLEGVERVRFSYRRPPQLGGGWSEVWEAPTLPTLVSIRLEFSATSARHWPTIVVAPLRGRVGE